MITLFKSTLKCVNNIQGELSMKNYYPLLLVLISIVKSSFAVELAGNLTTLQTNLTELQEKLIELKNSLTSVQEKLIYEEYEKIDLSKINQLFSEIKLDPKKNYIIDNDSSPKNIYDTTVKIAENEINKISSYGIHTDIPKIINNAKRNHSTLLKHSPSDAQTTYTRILKMVIDKMSEKNHQMLFLNDKKEPEILENKIFNEELQKNSVLLFYLLTKILDKASSINTFLENYNHYKKKYDFNLTFFDKKMQNPFIKKFKKQTIVEIYSSKNFSLEISQKLLANIKECGLYNNQTFGQQSLDKAQPEKFNFYPAHILLDTLTRNIKANIKEMVDNVIKHIQDDWNLTLSWNDSPSIVQGNNISINEIVKTFYPNISIEPLLKHNEKRDSHNRKDENGKSIPVESKITLTPFRNNSEKETKIFNIFFWMLVENLNNNPEITVQNIEAIFDFFEKNHLYEGIANPIFIIETNKNKRKSSIHPHNYLTSIETIKNNEIIKKLVLQKIRMLIDLDYKSELRMLFDENVKKGYAMRYDNPYLYKFVQFSNMDSVPDEQQEEKNEVDKIFNNISDNTTFNLSTYYKGNYYIFLKKVTKKQLKTLYTDQDQETFFNIDFFTKDGLKDYRSTITTIKKTIKKIGVNSDHNRALNLVNFNKFTNEAH